MKKTVALILIILMLTLTPAAFPVSAEETGSFPFLPFDSDYTLADTRFKLLETSPTGLQDYVMLDEDGNILKSKGLKPARSNVDMLAPSSYDLRNVNGISYVTSVKDQGDYGACWSFAAVGALESNLIKQGMATTSIDLSELHTAWYAYTKNPDSASTTYNDGINYTGTDKYNAGGRAETAYALWGSGEGLQLDANAPYSNAPNTSFFTETQRSESYFRVKEAYQIPSDNREAIKNSIMTNGAMYVSFWLHGSCFNTARSTYYNPSYDSSNDGYPNGGHAVLIVGWNNSYSASNFVNTPPGNGAWLCKNSWGTDSGNAGYFWISYYDHAIDNFTTFIGTSNDNCDNFAQYERSGFPLWWGLSGALLANVFTAQKSCTLNAVAFRIENVDGYLGDPGFDYDMFIYRNLPTTTVTDPSAGTFVTEVKGHCDYGGYYTVNLPSTISLNTGEKYSIIIVFKSVSYPYDGYVYFNSEANPSKSLYDGVNTVSGRSFIYDGNTKLWVDTKGTTKAYGVDFDGNFPIKALTNDIDTNYTAIRAQVQTQLDQTDGCTQGNATPAQWAAFTAARTFCGSVVNNGTASKADLNNSLIRMKLARDGATGIVYPTSSDYTLSVSNGIATVTAYNGTGKTVTVPKALNGYTLAIGATAFNNKTNLETVYIAGSPSSITATAFSGCTKLKFVYFMGNAPSVTGTVGTVTPLSVPTYYKNGTTGWTSSPWTGKVTAVVPGDFNNLDGMNMSDAVLFIQRLAQVGSYTTTEFAAIDVNRDGAVNMADIVKLVQALANPSIVLQ